MTVSRTEDDMYAAVAFRGEDLIAVAFYEHLVDAASEEYVFTHLWEVRALPVPHGYPNAMPAEELEERLLRWEAHEVPHLQSEYSDQLAERSLRSVPFHRMAQEVVADYFGQEASTELVLPTEEQLDACRAVGAFPGFRSSRDMESAIDQLKAVNAYVTAINSGDQRPIVAAARMMFGDETSTHITRIRNLIQFARQNGYLTKPQHGRSGGIPTRKALELCEALKSRAEEVTAK